MIRHNLKSFVIHRLLFYLILLFSITACSIGRNVSRQATHPTEAGSNTDKILQSETPENHPSPHQPETSTSPDPTFTPTKPPEDEDFDSSIRFPAQSDWVDHGIIFEAGAQGEWDYYLWGGFAFSVIKKDHTYYLYYQGASDYRTEYDETVMWRAIGVATSKDGIHFQKYNNNPLITWFPNKNGEEGAVSSGVTIGQNQEIFLYYGANTEESLTSVNADIRLASSLDGFDFTDGGKVLDHNDQFVWGRGDELFSVDAIYDQDKWIVYYIPNGTPESGLLGVAYGDQPTRLNNSLDVTSNGKKIPVWGTAGHVRLDTEKYALILNNVREKRTEVRLGFFNSPNTLSEPVAIYQFEEVQQAILFLDRQLDTWFMYYRTFDNSYGVKLAPANWNIPSLNSMLPSKSLTYFQSNVYPDSITR